MQAYMRAARKHLAVYWGYFRQYWKSRLVYKADFLLGFVGQAISLAISLAFLTLLFTQVDTIQGWTYTEMLFLAGFGGFIMNLHHLFLFNMFNLEEYVVQGRMDRFLVRPLDPLFQVYADDVSDNNLSKLIVNAGVLAYTVPTLGIPVTPVNAVYFVLATASGVLIFAATYLAFAATAFWTGRSQSAIWLIFQVTDFRRYPYGIYGTAAQIVLVTLIPIAFASFFPATYFLQKPGWDLWQALSLVAGPVYFLAAYRFWRYGLTNYSSTGS